ncbi:MAG TPA: extracellular solute-binding protein [Natronincola sp.]|nr:extracellular solute-binding protein [Natronincola sp.]
MLNRELRKTLTLTFTCLLALLWMASPSVGASATSLPSYEDYLASFPHSSYPTDEIFVSGYSFTNTDAEIEILDKPFGYEDSALWIDERGFVEWEVWVEEAGFYNIELDYYPVKGRSTAIERSIEINGAIPFDGAEYLVFRRVFGDQGPVRVDAGGNEIRAPQVEKPIWQKVFLSDSQGYEQHPYFFYFEEGLNTIRLTARAEPLIIGHFRLNQAPIAPSYAETIELQRSQYGKPQLENVFLQIEGESAIYRSSPSLFPIFDQGDPTVVPYHHAETRLNSIGGHRWQDVGDWIAWEVDIPEDGFYQIAIKGKQNLNRGTFSNRRLLIDGKVPFAEMNAIRFNYSTRYDIKQLGLEEQDEPFLFYLTAGKHEIRLEAVLGEMGDLIRLTEDTLYELNHIYRNIIMITSSTPDPMRSYQLEQRVPDLLERIGNQAAALRKMAAEFERITGQRGGHTATLTDFARMLERMQDKPDSVPNLLQEYRDAIGHLGTWIMTSREQPLQVDFLVVASPEQKMPRAKPTILEATIHEIKAFGSSFVRDYTSVWDIEQSDAPKKGEAKRIKVWIGLGRDQAQILKQMIEDSFTPETGIFVDLELITTMDQLLVPATIAGNQPDVAIGAANMDMAFRGAVADLTQFDDFPEIAKRFKKSALLTFRFRDQVFALPEVQSFPMMFYRIDILDELGLEVPQTWDDLFKILPELQNNHLEFGIWPSIYTYVQFMYQRGLSLYKEDVVEVNLASQAGISIFTEMTNLFTQSGLPLEYNFINRFRMGEMPLAIANYGEFNTLSVFASELRGQWGMAPIPGTMQEDGVINRAVPVAQDALVIRTDQTGSVIMPAGTTGSIILEKSQNQAEAWEFLKWWTSKETQVRFGQELEALIGAAARFATANVEAMQELPWRIEERDQLNIQWDWVEGVPPVLGGYYVTRQFDWLFRAVVLQNEPIRESVLDYTREINNEIARKRAEFGYETDYDKVDDRLKELFWDHYTHVYRLDWESPEIDEEYRNLLERYDLLIEGAEK